MRKILLFIIMGLFIISCLDSEPKPVTIKFNGVWFSFDSTYQYNFHDNGWHERKPKLEEGRVKWRVETADLTNSHITMWLVLSDSNDNHIETYSPRFSISGDSARMFGLLGDNFSMHR